MRFDAASRALYSTDASVYQIEPRGVVLPRSLDDVVRVVEVAARHGVPITARGGGTSQAGQAIGAGLVLDTSKYLNRILDIDPDRRLARVQPGVVWENIDSLLRVAVSASATFVLPIAGTYSIGFCVMNTGVLPLNQNDYVNGWAMVTN